jgi:hypothetical protein
MDGSGIDAGQGHGKKVVSGCFPKSRSFSTKKLFKKPSPHRIGGDVDRDDKVLGEGEILQRLADVPGEEAGADDFRGNLTCFRGLFRRVGSGRDEKANPCYE